MWRAQRGPAVWVAGWRPADGVWGRARVGTVSVGRGDVRGVCVPSRVTAVGARGWRSEVSPMENIPSWGSRQE